MKLSEGMKLAEGIKYIHCQNFEGFVMKIFHDKKRYSKCFSTSEYGDTLRAYDAAVKFRQRLKNYFASYDKEIEEFLNSKEHNYTFKNSHKFGKMPKGITRIDNEFSNVHGFSATVKYRKERYNSFFSDNVYGDAFKALNAAIAYRDETEKRIGKIRTDRHIHGINKRNNTGVVGVVKKVKNGNDVFEVSWNSEPNKLCKTTVSIKRYGEKEAFRRACAIRKSKIKEFYN